MLLSNFTFKIHQSIIINLQLVIFVVFSFNTRVLAKSYYVSIENGSDLFEGTILNPFKSISKGVEMLKEGDSLFIREGTYYLHQQVKLKSNTHLFSYNNEKVEIHGTELKNQWIKYDNNLWKCSQKDSVIQLFINKTPYLQASYPTIPESKEAFHNGLNSIAYPNKEIYIPGLNKFDQIIGAKIFGLHGKGLVALNGVITFQHGDVATLDNNAFYWNEAYTEEYLGNGKAFVVGSKKFLDDEKEWYWENQELSLICSTDPNTIITEVRTSIYSFDLSDLQNCTLRGFTFIGTNLNLTNARNCSISDCIIKYSTPLFTFPDGFERYKPLVDNENHIYYDKPENWTGKGITISGTNNKIENCYISDSWGDGLTIWGEEHIIQNNTISDCDWIGIDCSPLTITGKNHLIMNNTLKNGGRSILNIRKIKTSNILNNDIYNGGLLCEDAGLIYCYETDGESTLIKNNYLHDLKCKLAGAGLYLDNYNYNFQINSNVITNNYVGININKPSENNTIYNNTLYKNIYSMGSWGPTGTSLKKVYTFNNLTDSDKKQNWNYDAFYGTQLEANYLYNNNPFEDPFTNDFRLKDNAYPIDKGIKNEFTIDYINLPDIGAYEFGETKRIVGARLTTPCFENEQPFPAYDLSLDFKTNDTTSLKWTYYSSGIDTFLIERRKSEDENFQTIGYTSNNVFNYYDTTKNLFGSYIYQVRAKNKFGISEPTNSIKVFKSNYSQAIVLEAERNDDYKGITLSKDEISNCDNLNYVAFKQIDLDGGYDACVIRYAVPCEFAFQNVQIRLDNAYGKIIGQYITLPTGGWDKFDTISIPIIAVKGIHDIYFVFKGEFGVGTFDWFTFIKSNKTILSSRINTDTNCIQITKKQKTIPIKLFPNPGFGDLRVSFINKETLDVGIEIYSYEGFLIFKNEYPERKEGEVEIYINEELFDSYKQQGMFLVKVTLNNAKRNQETVLKYIRT